MSNKKARRGRAGLLTSGRATPSFTDFRPASEHTRHTFALRRNAIKQFVPTLCSVFRFYLDHPLDSLLLRRTGGDGGRQRHGALYGIRTCFTAWFAWSLRHGTARKHTYTTAATLVRSMLARGSVYVCAGWYYSLLNIIIVPLRGERRPLRTDTLLIRMRVHSARARHRME